MTDATPAPSVPGELCGVLRSAPVLVWTGDRTGRLVFLSDHWETFTGVPVARLLDGAFCEVVHPDDLPKARAALEGVDTAGARVIREYRLRRADGLWRAVLDTAVRVAGEEGPEGGWVGTCEDVTERNEFLSVIRFQRAVSECLAGVGADPGSLEALLRSICVEGGLDEATLCRVAPGSPTRIHVRFADGAIERPECTCWRANDAASASTFRSACSRARVPVVGSYPIRSGGRVTGLLTLGSRRGAEVFLPLLESLAGTASVLGALLERNDAEEKLRTSEERYRALLEQSSEGVFTFDPATHRVLDVNRQFLRITGYAREDVVSLTLEDLIAHDASSIAENVSRVVVGGESIVGERLYRRRDGTAVPVEVSASLVTWAEEQVVLVNVRDVSEVRAATAELEALSRRLRLILDSASDGILGLDRDGRITFVNKAAAAQLGWSVGELLGADSHRCWHHTKPDGSVHPSADCPILGSMRTASRVSVTDDVFCRKDGSRFPVRYEASPKREAGKVVGAVVVFHDVSREERLESIAAAVESMNSLGFVFSAVRHELGNPVNSVKMALSVLRKNLDRFDPATVSGLVDRSLVELSRVEELLASLKTYSLYEDVQIRVLDVAAFVSDFASFVCRDFAGRGVAISVEEAEGSTFAAADARALRHVLLNLVANAAEAMGPDGGSIRLRVASEEDWVVVRVEDDGPGMTTETVANLFRPFYTTKATGTGLGLVIAKKMMTKMGGTIEAAGNPGRGVTMTVSLRAAQAPPDR
ncbi:MAG: PAS domain S-box protein [Thermoanaerobaculia bacterium]|nr:PAS domain S-box protein [Thermoanaerobaculia bacterium]